MTETEQVSAHSQRTCFEVKTDSGEQYLNNIPSWWVPILLFLKEFQWFFRGKQHALNSTTLQQFVIAFRLVPTGSHRAGSLLCAPSSRRKPALTRVYSYHPVQSWDSFKFWKNSNTDKSLKNSTENSHFTVYVGSGPVFLRIYKTRSGIHEILKFVTSKLFTR